MHDEPLRDRAQGRWRAILPALGLPETFLTGRNGPCFFCGGRDRWRFVNREGSGSFVCSQCGKGDGPMLAMRVLNLGFADAAKRIEAVLGDVGEAEREIPRKEVSRDAMRRLWNGASRIEGTPGELYFKSRGLQAPGCLRYSPQVWYAKDASAPAILAKVASPEGQCVNLYRIFITRDGEKAAMDSPKKMMRASVPPGAAVRLYPRGSTLGIAEGIENAIAASAMFEMPVWATLGTAFMERFVVPEGVEDLVVFADNDKNMSGQKAAYVLAHHVAMNGISVKVEIPSCVGQDWNDVLLEKV